MSAPALDQFGSTQRRLLQHLLVNPGGASVEDLVAALAITPNAVRQHIAALERDGFVRRGGERPTRRRPQTLYQLSDAGREVFPRHYSAMADQLIEQTRSALGSEGLLRLMTTMGTETGRKLAGPSTEAPGPGAAAVSLAAAMTEAGYEAQANPAEGEVTAYNCVFHRLASRFPEVCEYDLAFIRAVTGRSVDHTECMVRGGEACRFRLGGKLPSAKPDSGSEPST